MSEELAPNGKRKVAVHLIGSEGNAFGIVSRCLFSMRLAKWPDEERHTFAREAVLGDMNHLLEVVARYCVPDGEGRESLILPHEVGDTLAELVPSLSFSYVEDQTPPSNEDEDEDDDDEYRERGPATVLLAVPQMQKWARKAASHTPLRERRPYAY